MWPLLRNGNSKNADVALSVSGSSDARTASAVTAVSRLTGD